MTIRYEHLEVDTVIGPTHLEVTGVVRYPAIAYRGLAIVWMGNYSKVRPWTIVHMASGRVVTNYTTERRARAALQAIVDLTDWWQPMHTMDFVSLSIAVRNRLRQLRLHSR